MISIIEQRYEGRRRGSDKIPPPWITIPAVVGGVGAAGYGASKALGKKGTEKAGETATAIKNIDSEKAGEATGEATGKGVRTAAETAAELVKGPITKTIVAGAKKGLELSGDLADAAVDATIATAKTGGKFAKGFAKGINPEQAAKVGELADKGKRAFTDNVNLEATIAIALFEKISSRDVAIGAGGAAVGAGGYNEVKRLYHASRAAAAEKKGDLDKEFYHGLQHLAHDQASPWRTKVAKALTQEG